VNGPDALQNPAACLWLCEPDAGHGIPHIGSANLADWQRQQLRRMAADGRRPFIWVAPATAAAGFGPIGVEGLPEGRRCPTLGLAGNLGVNPCSGLPSGLCGGNARVGKTDVGVAAEPALNPPPGNLDPAHPGPASRPAIGANRLDVQKQIRSRIMNTWRRIFHLKVCSEGRHSFRQSFRQLAGARLRRRAMVRKPSLWQLSEKSGKKWAGCPVL
jgi:hypothetical protein